MDYDTLDQTAMVGVVYVANYNPWPLLIFVKVSLMDDSGNLREVIQYPASTTMMDNTAVIYTPYTTVYVSWLPSMYILVVVCVCLLRWLYGIILAL